MNIRLLLHLTLTATLLAQQKVPSLQEIRTQHDITAAAQAVPARDYEQFAPYWTAEGGWHTELQLRNNLSADSLVVTPTLRTFDGSEVALKPVTLLSERFNPSIFMMH